MEKRNLSTYMKLVRLLKKELPPSLPIHVRRVQQKCDGYCQKRNGRFYITIDNRLNEQSAIDSLLHEWAHALNWKSYHDKLSPSKFEEVAHDESWGIAYSKVYRFYDSHIDAILQCER